MIKSHLQLQYSVANQIYPKQDFSFTPQYKFHHTSKLSVPVVFYGFLLPSKPLHGLQQQPQVHNLRITP